MCMGALIHTDSLEKTLANSLPSQRANSEITMDTNALERSKHFLKHLQSSLKGDQVTQKSTSCILNIIIFCMGMALWISRDHFKASNIQHCSVKKAKCSRLKPSRPHCEIRKSWIILLPHNTVLLGAPVPVQILPETTHHVPLKLSLYDCVRLKFTFKVLKKKMVFLI